MIPEELDDDSNFVLEVTCSDGSFEVPKNWPPEQCTANVSCAHFPEPPVHAKLVRAGRCKEMRPGDMAYFVCQNTEMLLKPNGTNMFSASCDQARVSNIMWPNCTLDPVCVMPLCLAQCPTEKVLPEIQNMILDTQSRTEIWEQEKIW